MKPNNTAEQASIRDFIKAGRALARQIVLPLSTCEHEERLLKRRLLASYTETLIPFVIEEERQPVAKALLILPPEGIQALFGFFQALPRQGACETLIARMKAAATAAGKTELLGPINFTSWNDYRLLSSGHPDTTESTQDYFFLEPRNPEYYSGLLEGAGLTRAESWYSALCEDPRLHITRTEELTQRYFQAGYTIRPLNQQFWQQELRSIYTISMKAFPGSPYFKPITWPNFYSRYKRLRSVLDPELCLFAVNPQGRDIGFIFALPDYELFHKAPPSGPTLFQLLRFLHDKRKGNYGRAAYSRVILKTLAVESGLRRVLPGLALAHRLNSILLERGITELIHAMMRSDNRSLRISALSAAPFREYSLYRTEL